MFWSRLCYSDQDSKHFLHENWKIKAAGGDGPLRIPERVLTFQEFNVNMIYND